MHIVTLILIAAAPYVQLPAGDYTICNKQTRGCIEVSGGHRVDVAPELVRAPDAVEPAGTERAPRGILLAGGLLTGDGVQGRASVAFGGDTWFLEPRLTVRPGREVEYGITTADYRLPDLVQVDLGFSFGLDSGSRPWFFALALDLGLVFLAGDDDRHDYILHADAMSTIAPPDDDPGLNAGVIARVGLALGEHLFVAVDAHVDVALLEHRATREKVTLGVRTGLGVSF
jgi:hypothetical protein